MPDLAYLDSFPTALQVSATRQREYSSQRLRAARRDDYILFSWSKYLPHT